MTLTNFRRIARKETLTAIIISDGCRDYVVEIRSETGAGVLTDRKGQRLRFSSLDQAKRAVRDAREVHLAVRVAADEACGGATPVSSPFSLMTVSKADAA